LQQRLPSIGWPDYAAAGGVMACGVKFLRAGETIE
jgi:hypothetical protein